MHPKAAGRDDHRLRQNIRPTKAAQITYGSGTQFCRRRWSTRPYWGQPSEARAGRGSESASNSAEARSPSSAHKAWSELEVPSLSKSVSSSESRLAQLLPLLTESEAAGTNWSIQRMPEAPQESAKGGPTPHSGLGREQFPKLTPSRAETCAWLGANVASDAMGRSLFSVPSATLAGPRPW